MKFKKSELTQIAKDIAYANTKLLDAIGVCEDITGNEVFEYLRKECMAESDEYRATMLEVAKKVKKYSRDGMAGDSECYAAPLADASQVFRDIFGIIDELDEKYNKEY